MKARAAILLFLLVGTVLAALHERGGARWGRAGGWFLDFVIANARDRFDKDAVAPSGDVVFIELNEKDKGEFGAWPPPPDDYLTMLKRIVPHEPEVVAFGDVLAWKDDGPQSPVALARAALQNQFVRFQQVLLAFSAKPGTADKTSAEELDLPSVSLHGSASDMPEIEVAALPDKMLRTQMQLGFVPEGLDDPQKPAHLAARLGDRLVPSLAAQMIALQEHALPSEMRLRTGAGAGYFSGTGRFIPLSDNGAIAPHPGGDMVRVNGLELLTPDLGDDAGKAVSAKLGMHKLVVLGTAGSAAETQARIAAWALALPRIQRAPEFAEWMAAGIAAVLAFWQLRFRRVGALVFGVVVMLLALAASLVVFQSSLAWLPPMLPLTLVVVSTLFCLLWTRRVAAAEAPDNPAAA